jgi:hypothetical protein
MTKHCRRMVSALVSLALSCVAGGCAHAAENPGYFDVVDPWKLTGPGGIETIELDSSCRLESIKKAVNPSDTKLVVDRALQLVGRLRGKTIPYANARSAVAAGLPVVESVFGTDLNPVIGPGFDTRPFESYVWLTAFTDDTVSSCKRLNSNERLEFLYIMINWKVREKRPSAGQSSGQGQPFYNYGVLLGKHLGKLFYFGEDWTKE